MFFYDKWPRHYVVDQATADIAKCFGLFSKSLDLEFFNSFSNFPENVVGSNDGLDWNDDEVNHLWGSRVHGGG